MVMKYSLSLCSCSRGGEGEEGGPSLCAAQDIELPLPQGDTLNAPSGRRETNRSKEH